MFLCYVIKKEEDMTDKACFFILFDDLFEKINEIEENIIISSYN